MNKVSAEGDETWKIQINEVIASVRNGAPFATSGIGFQFKYASNGPFLMVPPSTTLALR